MVETVTTHYAWTKPEVTKSASTWGGFLNNDLDAIDAQIFANQGLLANYLPLTGGTITGDLTVSGTAHFGTATFGNITASGSFTASGNISASGNVTSSATVQGAYVTSTGNVNANGNVTAGNVNASGTVTAGNVASGTVSASGTVTGSGGVISGAGMSAYSSVNLRSTGGDARYVIQDSSVTERCSYGWQASTGYTYVSNAIGGGWFAMDQGNGFLTSAPNTYKPGGGSWQAFSDARIKTIDGAYDKGLAAVLALRPVRYHYRGNDRPTADAPSLHAHVTNRSFIGLVAQEVEAVLPEMVSKAAGFIDGRSVADLRQLDTSSLVFALVNAVRELSAEVAALKARTP